MLNQEGLDASVCEQLDEIPLKEERIECTNRRVRQSVIPSIGAESGTKTMHMIKCFSNRELRTDKNRENDQIISIDIYC